jgi:plastocyanin domain-containing protein
LVKIFVGEPSSVTVDAGRPVKITVAKGEGCAAGFYMPELGIEKDNSAGPVTFTLDPLDPGTYTYTCGMGMVSGSIVVK